MASVTFNGSSPELKGVLSRLPRVLAGKEPDPWGVAQGLQLRLGVTLLSKVQQAFITKSRGGQGDDGINWAPLKRATIANRRPAPHKRRGEIPRGLLTDDQDTRWRKVFARTKAYLMVKFGMGDQDAAKIAAGKAWNTVKGEGAKTKLEVYGNRQVDSLRDTGELFKSLSPGVEGRPSGANGQIFEVPPGRVIVGTNKKVWHHRGIPGKLPARPFWPESLPDNWWTALFRSFKRGLTEAMARIVGA